MNPTQSQISIFTMQQGTVAHGHAGSRLAEHGGERVAGAGRAAQRVAARAVALLAQIAEGCGEAAPQPRALPLHKGAQRPLPQTIASEIGVSVLDC